MDWWDNSKKEIARILKELSKAENKKGKAEEGPEVQKRKQEEIEDSKQIRLSDNNPDPQTGISPVSDPVETDDGVQLKGVVRNVTGEKKPVITYKATALPYDIMNPDEFITPTRAHYNDVVQKVMSVLNTESPINENLLTRRVVQSYSIARTGSRIQAFMYSIYRALNLNYTMQGDERFYWKHSQNPHTYREFRANGAGANKRDAKEIPIQEASNAVCRALEEQFSLPQEDLIRAAANLMGINRIGSSVSALFLGGITWACWRRELLTFFRREL